MPKSYAIRVIKDKNPQKTFSVPVQQTILEGDEAANTEYYLAHESYVNNIDKYWACHELLVKKPGRANGKIFNYYFEPHRFPFFHDKDRNLIYIGSKKQVVNSFLCASNYNKSWTAVNINYSAMDPLLPPITGAWFCELKLAYVKSAGYFGQHVNKSEEFKSAAKLGNISVLYINVPAPDGHEYRVGITSEGAILLSKNMELEEDEIKLVTQVYDTYIAPTLES